jgi:FixJ family two-component response regulator
LPRTMHVSPSHRPHQDQPLLPIGPVISVIDDDASIRVAIDSLLRARSYIVYTFASASEFLQSPHLDEAACVITDVRMPNMSGVELQTAVRNQGRSVPFIFVTAFPEESARIQALHDGAVCFLSKPFDAPTLIRCVEAALALRDASRR